jgi:hypothetical protein
MDRRNFFKGMFGAAIVASMPKIVVEQIEETPIEELTPIPKEAFEQVVSHVKEKCLYLYDNEKLIAGSTDFALELRRDILPIDIDPIKNYPEYTTGKLQWNIAAYQLRWFNHKTGLHYFRENEPLQCVISYQGIRYKGDVYVTECSLTQAMMDNIQEDVMLEGTGNLIIENNETINTH